MDAALSLVRVRADVHKRGGGCPDSSTGLGASRLGVRRPLHARGSPVAVRLLLLAVPQEWNFGDWIDRLDVPPAYENLSLSERDGIHGGWA
ncbi:MAG: hypothetical protein PVI86_03095 [Phycisphaerae bacterium]